MPGLRLLLPLALLIAPAAPRPIDVVEELRAWLDDLPAPALEELALELDGAPTVERLVEPADEPDGAAADVDSGLAALGRALVAARRAGEHEAAAHRAREIEERLAAALGAEHWRTREAGYYTRLLDELARRSEDEQLAFAEVYSATLDIPRLFGSGAVDEALARALTYQRVIEEVLGPEHPEGAANLYSLAALLHARGEFGLARRAALASWPGLDAEPGLRRLRAMALNVLATLCTSEGDLDAAEHLARASLAGRRATTGTRDPGYATSLVNLANGLILAGDLERARLLHERALELRLELGGVPALELLNSLVNLGQIEGQLGRAARSHELLSEAVAQGAELGPAAARDLAFAHSLLADLAFDEGDLLRAEREARTGLAILAERFPSGHPDRSHQLQVLARVQLAGGDLAAAQVTAEAALEAARGSDGRPGVNAPGALDLFAAVLAERGEPERALERARRSLALREELTPDARPALATARALLARRLADAGRLAEAREAAARSRAEVDAIHAPYGAQARADARVLEGELALRAGALDEARAAFARAVELLAEHAPGHAGRAACELGLGLVAREEGELERAARHLEAALARLEARRARIGGGERERALYAGRLDLAEVARTLAVTRLELGRADEALLALERGRALPLLDLLAEARLDVEAELARRDLELLPEYRAAVGRIDAARAAHHRARHRSEALRARSDLGDAREARVRAADRELQEASRALEQRERELADLLDRWNLFDALRPPAATLRDLRGVPALEQGHALLEYLWSEELVACFVLEGAGAERAVGVHVVAGGRAAVAALAARVEELARAAESGADWADDARALAAALLPPERSPEESWIVVPDGPLTGLPLELLAPERPLSTSLSATLLSELHDRAPAPDELRRHAVVLGDPRFDGAEGAPAARGDLARLPGSAREARLVADLLERAGTTPRVLVDEDATRAGLERDAAGARVLHLATHGWPGRPERPLSAGLALAGPAPQSTLTLERLFESWRELLQGCELVTLSACESGRGTRVGDSHLALSWGFWVAGADCVLVSRWRVDDRASLLLMRRFYEGWLGLHEEEREVAGERFAPGRRLPAAAALAEARAWLAARDARANRRDLEELGLEGDARSRDEGGFPRPGAAPVTRDALERFDYSHPRHWAAFVLVGAPR